MEILQNMYKKMNNLEKTYILYSKEYCEQKDMG